MCDNHNEKLNSFITSLLDLLQSHIEDSESGYHKSTQIEYWFGRLSESNDLKSDIKKLIIEKLWND